MGVKKGGCKKMEKGDAPLIRPCGKNEEQYNAKVEKAEEDDA